MKFKNWDIDRLNDVRTDEFYELVANNTAHISRTFPVTVSSCRTASETAEFLAAAADKEREGKGYHFFIRNLETERLIGYICVKNIEKRIPKCELAYFVDQDYNRRGIISSALEDILAICFTSLGMNKVLICTAPDNRGSQRIAIKNGFKLEGIHRQEFRNGDGILEDINYYGLIKSDFNERQVL